MTAEKRLRTILRRRDSFRFPLELPTVVHWEEEGAARTISAYTKNLSSSGLYLLVDKTHQPATNIEFEVGMPAPRKEKASLMLRGKGRLIRAENLGENRVGMAATIDRYELCRATRLAGRAFQWLHRSRRSAQKHPL